MKNKKIIFITLALTSMLTSCSNNNENSKTNANSKEMLNEQAKKEPQSKKVESIKVSKKLSSNDLKKYKPNEMGLVMLLEYHSIARPEARWSRTPENFRKDLDTLYKQGYYLVPFRDFVLNKMNVPLGKSPIVLTFDDSREDQFRYIKNGKDIVKIDPDCGVGIIEDFTKKHPDFGKAATFYVLPYVAFGQTKEDSKKKFEFLANNGYEIGNHTVNHPMLPTLSDEKVVKEIAGNVEGVQKLLPKYEVNTLAYPFGGVPKNLKLAEQGEYKGIKYKNIAALLVGSEPSYSPNSKKFKPMLLPRIQAIQSEFARHFALFKSIPGYKYISDGDKESITIPNNLPEGIKNTLRDDLKNNKKVVRY